MTAVAGQGESTASTAAGTTAAGTTTAASTAAGTTAAGTTTSGAGAAAAARILRDLRADPGTVRAAADAARGRAVPEGRSLPRHEIVRHVHILLDAVIAMVQGSPDREEMARNAEGLAEDLAAQGVSLAALLTGIQAARSIVLDGLISRLRELVAPDEMAAALAALDAEVAPVMTRMVVVHQEAERRLARTSSVARQKALRRLLVNGDPAAAEELGLDPKRRYHCLVADVSTPREARAADTQIRTTDGVSGLVNGALCRVSSHLPAIAPGPGGDPGGVLMVASPPVGVEELPAAHALCRQGVEIARRHGHTGLRSLIQYAVDLAVAGQPLLSRFLADGMLGRLDPGDPFHRQLAETARVYLSHGSRLDVTSAVLHVHPNTVSHRLRRLGALTGFAHTAEGSGPDDFARAARWWWALDAWLARADQR